MEYNYGTNGYNHNYRVSEEGFFIKDMRIIRLFRGNESEKGFLYVHNLITGNSGPLIQNIVNCLEAIKKDDGEQVCFLLGNLAQICKQNCKWLS